MADEMSCPECGTDIESTDDLETEEISVIEPEEDDGGSFSLYGSNDLFLCSGCRKPLGVGSSRRDK